MLATPDALNGDRALNPGNRHPDWQQEIAARSALRIGFYRPGRAASRVECPLLVLAYDQDDVAPADASARAGQGAPHATGSCAYRAGTTSRSWTVTSRPWSVAGCHSSREHLR